MSGKIWAGVAAVMMGCVGSAQARVILIDFGNHPQAGLPSTGGVWNTVAAGANQQVLKDLAGNVTSYRLTTSGFVELTTSQALEKWKQTGTWIDENASRDPLLTANSIPSPPGTVTLSGLNPGEVLAIHLVASTSNSTFRNAFYTINGVAFHPPMPGSQPGVFNAYAGWFNSSVMVWNPISANAAGELVLRVAPDADNQRGAINAMRIEWIPEPGVGLGLVAGSLGLLSRRRRQGHRGGHAT